MENTLPLGVSTMKPGNNAASIGPYSCGKIINAPEGMWGYSSGQVGRNPEYGALVSTSEAAGQAFQALTNLQNLAEANGFILSKHTIKTTVFLTCMSDFAAINVEYSKFFNEPDSLPARSCVAVKELPMGANFEIEAVFFKSHHI